MNIKSLLTVAFAFLLTLILAFSSYSQSADTTPPQLVSLSFSPTSINTSDAPQTISFTMRVTDNLTGVANGSVYLSFTNPSGNKQYGASAYLVSGDSKDGIYQATIGFPRYAEIGAYTATVTLYDEIRNYVVIRNDELASKGFPSTLAISGTLQDITSPQLISLHFNPTSINTSDAPQSISFTMRVTDDLTGVANGSVYLSFTSPSGNKQYGANAYLVSGNSSDGIYQATIAFPQFSEAGTYTATVTLYDEIRNYKVIRADELASNGFPSTLQVSSTQQDTTPPQLVSLNFSPSSITTSSSSQLVSFSMRVTDNFIGVANGSVYLSFTNPSGNKQYGANAYLASGDSKDGIYQATIGFPQYAENGTYTATVTLYDNLRNYRVIRVDELSSNGFPSTLRVNALPTAASVTIGGRILNSSGRAISKATVVLTNVNGEQISAITNPFGYYRFADVTVGNTYILTVNAKKYAFSPKVFAVNNEETDLNLTANP